ncbi:helix-turn-helix transcriptional regulator [Streptomyces tubercidicus]|uniref:response regulator transcription factor n=1 Tax=Streptomyces tubercidicus TaxID=47759 RepID=UPI002E186EDB|nr:helix-turn-helix transcriptional regulator [Streptomyces tubercidicus]
MPNTQGTTDKPHLTRRIAHRPITPPPTPGDPRGIYLLTPRERQVLLLIGHAASNREIGRKLGIAERTVKAHLANLTDKIHVATRVEAAIFAYVHHQDIHPDGDRCPV